MKAIILAGGLGTRISEETTVRPKPMVEIGGKPVLWHIMKTYSAHGIHDFVICCGHKGYVIKEYFHSDRGSQYCSHDFQKTLDEYCMQSSMPPREAIHYATSRMWSCHSRKGNYWGNAPTESLWGSLKVGRLYGMRFETRRQAMDEVIDWLTYYNHKRLHSTLGYISPMQFEKNWFAAQLKDAT